MKKLAVINFVCGTGMALTLATGLALANDMSDCSKESHYPLITKAELQKVAKTKEAVIIDVNSKESFDKVHVPGAVHFGTHEKDLASFFPAQKSALIVAYCGGVKCAAWQKAAEVACKNGYTNVRHYKEGIHGWVENN